MYVRVAEGELVVKSLVVHPIFLPCLSLDAGGKIARNICGNGAGSGGMQLYNCATMQLLYESPSLWVQSCRCKSYLSHFLT